MKRMVAESKGKGTVPELRAEGSRFGTVHGMKGFVWGITLLAVAALSIVGCGGGGGGGGGGTTPPPAGGATTTTISGKVTLSATVQGKPMFARSMAGKPGTEMEKVLSAAGVSYATGLSGATVELYDADHSEWLYPVATATASSTAGSEGNYKLSTLVNAAKNTGATYTDGAAIPAGNYTLVAYNFDFSTAKLFVAVQAVVKKLAGDVAGNDLVAQDSAAVPSVVSMFGLPKNTDGTFGSSTNPLPLNAAIQVTFSMAMNRLSVLDAITITPSGSTAAVAGNWKISPDLLTATFTPTSSLTPSKAYVVAIGGGTAAKTAKNVYGKAVASTVKGYFFSSASDSKKPNVTADWGSLTSTTGVPITTPIRFDTDEPIDVTTVAVSSTPSVGDKPNIIYIGKVGKQTLYPYVYEVVLANPLTINATYDITISGGKDMAGNLMNSLPYSFTTEATSTGVTTGGTTATTDAQTAVKATLAKWIQAMNDKNISVLSSYMAGDFYWLNDPTHGSGSDDLNKDGRIDLNEFTAMLDSWFKNLTNCGSTVTGTIDVNNASVSGGIAVSGSTAQIAFTITIASTNTLDASCKDTGPQNVMYAELQNINGGWIMTRGSELPLAATVTPLTVITTSSPAKGTSLPEPTAAMPAAPKFTWTGVAGIASYAVVLIDAKSPWMETGWVGLVDGASTKGTTVSLQFTPATGYSGNVLVLPSGKAFGFRNSIADIKAGGSYYWAVLGFKTKTLADFNLGVANPLVDLGASSPSSNFTVGGVYKELTIKVTGASGAVYTWSDFSNGYTVGSEGSVTLAISEPAGGTATTANVNVNGYTSQNLTGTFTGGVATVGPISLSNNGNWVEVCDNWVSSTSGPGYCKGLSKQFDIFTSGGTQPLIKITGVSGTTSAGGAATLSGPDSWNSYKSADVNTVTVSGTIDSTITGKLWVQVWGDNGRYNTQISPSGLTFTATVPVFKGWNNVHVADQNWKNSNQVNIETATGSLYAPPIAPTVTAATLLTAKSSSMEGAYYDAGSAGSVTIGGKMTNVVATCSMGSPCSNWSQMDPNGGFVTSGNITTSTMNVTITLYTGMNTIYLHDSANNWYNLYINTTGGTAFVQPNVINTVNGAAYTAGTTVNAGTACIVAITGTTTAKGMPVYVNLNNGTIYDYQTVTANTTTGAYSITQSIYTGTNYINVNDSNYKWAGVTVTTTGTCAAPATLAVTGVTDPKGGAITPDAYGYYNTADSTVLITGTAAAGKDVTAYVYGLYSNTVTQLGTARGTATVFSLTVPAYNGYNYISITDGMNWQYLTVYTSAVTAAPFSITSVAPAAGDTGTLSTIDNWSYTGSASTITITGKGDVNGIGTWYGGGTSGSFTISGGNFTVNIPLLYGSNYVDLYDPNGRWAGIYVNTTGGVKPAQLVTITSPTQGSPASGTVNVTATIDKTKFTPSTTAIYGYVYDYVTYQSAYFSSNSLDYTGAAAWAKQLTYDTTTGVVSFSATVAAGNTTLIEVYAHDVTGMSHGHDIYVNSTGTGWTTWFWKPASKPVDSDAIARAHKAEFLREIKKNGR